MLKEILYNWNGANTAIFYAVNGIKGGELYEKTMLFGTMLADHHNFPFYFLFFVAIALFHVRRMPYSKRHAYLWAWGGVLTVFLISYAIDGVVVKTLKTFFAFPRPFEALPKGSVHLIGPMMDVSKHFESFPSGHASFAMLLVASLWPILHKIGKGMGVLFILWAGMSRLALGVHFPMDIVTGYVTCLLVVLVVRWGWNHLARRKLQRQLV